MISPLDCILTSLKNIKDSQTNVGKMFLIISHPRAPKLYSRLFFLFFFFFFCRAASVGKAAYASYVVVTASLLLACTTQATCKLLQEYTNEPKEKSFGKRFGPRAPGKVKPSCLNWAIMRPEHDSADIDKRPCLHKVLVFSGLLL